MTDKEILKAAIDKAVRNGWRTDHYFGFDLQNVHINECGFVSWNIYDEYTHIREIIFSHDFAKAFFKDPLTPINSLAPWQYHLQQMVIEEIPLQYLNKFL